MQNRQVNIRNSFSVNDFIVNLFLVTDNVEMMKPLQKLADLPSSQKQWQHNAAGQRLRLRGQRAGRTRSTAAAGAARVTERCKRTRRRHHTALHRLRALPPLPSAPIVLMMLKPAVDKTEL